MTAHLKGLAENLDFKGWNQLNSLNKTFNEKLLNNQDLILQLVQLLKSKLSEKVLPVPEGSELADAGYSYYLPIDLSRVKKRFTPSATGLDVADADALELSFTDSETGNQGLITFEFEKESNVFIKADRFSDENMAVLVGMPEKMNVKLSVAFAEYAEAGFQTLVEIGLLTNIENPKGNMIVDLHENSWNFIASLSTHLGDNLSVVLKQSVDYQNQLFNNEFSLKKRDAQLLDIGISGHGTSLVIFNNADSDLDVSESVETVEVVEPDGNLVIDNLLFRLLYGIVYGRSIDNLSVSLLDDLTLNGSISDCGKFLQLYLEARKARHQYADATIMDPITTQLNEVASFNLEQKSTNQQIEGIFLTTQFGVDYTPLPALRFEGEDGFTPINELIQEEDVEYAINILAHAASPLRGSLQTVSQLVRLVASLLTNTANQ